MTKTPTAGSPTKPKYVTRLEAVYGAPSQAGFGSAVFCEHLPRVDDLEQAGLAKYQFFVGDLWARFGEIAWLAPWQVVYTRAGATDHDIVAKLRHLQDHEARMSASLLLDDPPNGAEALAALALAFDDPAVTELVVYRLGDGDAMSGILIAGHHHANGEATFLVLLLD